MNSRQNAILRAKDWASDPAFDEDSRGEIQALLDAGNEREIEERFHRHLEFGTGGMRAPLGVGTNRMNLYNIRRASQAVAETVLADGGDKIAVCYDSRLFSFEFAKEAAGTFAAHGIEALIFRRLNPVALVSFAIRKYQCAAGVMVTASHNPRNYNGYKVFWDDGAQVTPPNDGRIIERFKALEDYSALKWMDFEAGLEKGLISWLREETEDAYFAIAKNLVLAPDLCKDRGSEIKIVYSPIHGTGKVPCVRALKEVHLNNVLVVPEQAEPDGNFPTVQFPNPEEPEALNLAVQLMQKESADIVIGTDPDSDRVGIAVPHKGSIHYPSGNQLGTLMLHYILSRLSEEGKMPPHPYMVKTIVTTPLQETIAQAFSVEVYNTITGFKWICNRVRRIEEESPERNFVFATEESFGYLNHTFVRDKDGVSATALIAEIALWYKCKGMTLIDALDEIYQQYGFSAEELVCLTFEGLEGTRKIARIMDHFRGWQSDAMGGQVIKERIDYQTGPDEIPPSNVLRFNFEGGNRLFLRPSGTEPKIKFYIMVQEQSGTLDDKKTRAEKTINTMKNFILQEVETL